MKSYLQLEDGKEYIFLMNFMNCLNKILIVESGPEERLQPSWRHMTQGTAFSHAFMQNASNVNLS